MLQKKMMICALSMLVLSACSTVQPIKMPFPEPPSLLMNPPQKLKLLSAKGSNIKLSTVAESVAENYQICNENSAQLISIQGWVKDQYEANK